jgi:hypothetical protein
VSKLHRGSKCRLAGERYGGGRGSGFSTAYVAPPVTPHAYSLSHDTAVKVAKITAGLERQGQITVGQANAVMGLVRDGDALGAHALLLDIQGMPVYGRRPSTVAKRRLEREAAFREAVKRAKERMNEGTQERRS